MIVPRSQRDKYRNGEREDRALWGGAATAKAIAGLHGDIATMGYLFLERVSPDFSIEDTASPTSFAYNTARLLTQWSW
jgi:hypothetical protein